MFHTTRTTVILPKTLKKDLVFKLQVGVFSDKSTIQFTKTRSTHPNLLFELEEEEKWDKINKGAALLHDLKKNRHKKDLILLLGDMKEHRLNATGAITISTVSTPILALNETTGRDSESSIRGKINFPVIRAGITRLRDAAIVKRSISSLATKAKVRDAIIT